MFNGLLNLLLLSVLLLVPGYLALRCSSLEEILRLYRMGRTFLVIVAMVVIPLEVILFWLRIWQVWPVWLAAILLLVFFVCLLFLFSLLVNVLIHLWLFMRTRNGNRVILGHHIKKNDFRSLWWRWRLLHKLLPGGARLIERKEIVWRTVEE